METGKGGILNFSFLWFITVGAMGQQYVSFPSSSASWNEYIISSCDEYQVPDTVILNYTMQGDTIIQDKIYHKIYQGTGDSLKSKSYYSGCLREENKKIYYIGQGFLGPAISEGEILLYDFTVGIGDTIWNTSEGHPYTTILDVDSIMIDGAFRKQYTVDNHGFYHNPDYIVEGIGSVLNGLLGHISEIPTCGYHYWEQICFQEEGVVKYLNPEFPDCYSVAREVPEKTYLSLFPADTTQWNVLECAIDLESTMAYYSISDTIINNHSYHTIFNRFIYPLDNNPFVNSNLWGYVREDPFSGKIWLMLAEPEKSDEFLWMNQSLSRGDYLLLWSIKEKAYTDSIQVDSVYFENNRRIHSFASGNSSSCISTPSIFIEGVGPSWGFGNFWEPANDWWETFFRPDLLCKHDGPLLSYSLEPTNSFPCIISGGDVPPLKDVKNWLIVYPNPSNGEVHFQVRNIATSEINISVYNTDGRLILNKKLISSRESMKIASPGLYFVKAVYAGREEGIKVLVTGN